MYPIFFKRRLLLHLALASLLAGTTIFVPQLGFLESWLAYVLTPLFFGGFFYLVWQNELLRAWNREQQVRRTARTLALRGLSMMWVGYLPFLFDFVYFAISRSDYPYAYYAKTIGGFLALFGTVFLSAGLVLDWRDFPKRVDQSARGALLKMKDAGLELDDRRLWIGVDPAISPRGYSGYSYPTGDDFVILVPPGSIYSREAGGLDQTLVHEMSHVYLWQKKHPSHLRETSKEAYRRTVEAYRKKWQVDIVSSAMNYPTEVFVEDLTFKTLRRAKDDWANANLQYFQRLSRTKRVSTHRRQGSWRNAWLVLRNCYYSAEMERYQMPDPEGIVKRTNERLLSSLPPSTSTAFDYFHRVFSGLRDDITAEDYKKTLEDYLSKFIALAEGNERLFH